MKIFFILFLVIQSANLFSKTVIISDIDDTLRQTNNLNFGGFNSNFFSGKSFDKMSLIFSDLSSNIDDIEFIYLSAAPKFIYNAEKWLKKNNFPRGLIRQKTIGDGNTYDYKYSFIMDIIKNDKSISEIIMFGDNASHDHDVYQEVCEKILIECRAFIRDVGVIKTYNYDYSQWNGLFIDGHISYFLSEKDLLGPLALHITDMTVHKINESFNDGTLIPEYIWKQIKGRVGKKNISKVKLQYLNFYK